MVFIFLLHYKIKASIEKHSNFIYNTVMRENNSAIDLFSGVKEKEDGRH